MLGAGVALALWIQGARRRELARLPDAERSELYATALRELDELCRAGLKSRCLDQAKFVADFPECDASCQRRMREIEYPAAPP